MPVSWHKGDLATKPSVQKQFMRDDQGKQIFGSPKRLWQQYRDCYRAKVALYDGHVGTVLAAMKKEGFWDDTLTVATSDHGDMDTHHRLIYKGPFMYDQMVRIPLIVRVPERFGGKTPRRVDDLDAVNVDLLPTVADFCRLEPVECDGISLKPALTGAPGQQRRDFVIGQYYSKQRWVNPIRMLRTPQFKYNRYITHGEELYDLKNDPHEIVNLAADPGYAKTKKELAGELAGWIRANADPFDRLKPTTRKGEPLGQ